MLYLCLAVILISLIGAVHLSAPTAKVPKWLECIFIGKNAGNSFLRLLAVLVLSEFLLFLVLSGIISSDMYTEGGYIPIGILLLAFFIPVLPVYITSKNVSLHRFLRRAAVGTVLLLLAEVLLFNAKSFTTDKNSYTLTPADITPTFAENIVQEENTWLLTGNAEMELFNIPDGTHALLLSTEQEQNRNTRLTHIWIDMKDENFKYEYQVTADRFTMASQGGCTLSFSPTGSIKSLLLHITDVSLPVRLTEIRAVSAVPFHFSAARFLVLFVLLVCILGIVEFRFYEVCYDRKRYAHRIAVAAMVLLCTWTAMLFLVPEEEPVEYVLGNDYSYSDPYIQTFDAFQKGQVWLDLEADPRLEELENVYDNSERNAMGAYGRWDYTYYKGKYYCYFGVTPVLMLYYPMYWLKGELPTVPITIAVFGTISAFLLCMTILEAVRLTISKPNFLLLLMSFPAAMCSSGVYFCLEYPDKYYVAVCSGMCFMLLTLWTGLLACRQKRPLPKCLLFAACGLSLALCVGARPTMAVSAAVLLPLFCGILLRKSQRLRPVQAGSFLLPLLLGVGGLLAYNAARFDSPFNFGAVYQLTINDISNNTLRFDLIPGTIKHFFLQTPVPRNSFPYFESVNSHLRNYGRYVYSDACYGALAHPSILMAVLLPLALRRKGMRMRSGVSTLEKRSFLVICMIVPLFVAWVDFCMAGINQRYITDIMPLLTIGTVIILLRTVDLRHHAHRYGIVLGSLVLTFCMVWLLMAGLRECSLLKCCPAFYDTAEELLIFWR